MLKSRHLAHCGLMTSFFALSMLFIPSRRVMLEVCFAVFIFTFPERNDNQLNKREICEEDHQAWVQQQLM